MSIYPPEGFYADDPKITYPFYEACLKHGIDTVFIHVGLQSQPQLELKYAHPLHLDAAARDFPGINFVCEHFAYPWEADLIAVAWKHPNVHICCTYLAAMAPWAPGPLWHAVGRAMRDLGGSHAAGVGIGLGLLDRAERRRPDLDAARAADPGPAVRGVGLPAAHGRRPRGAARRERREAVRHRR